MADVEDLSEQFSSPALAVGDALANEFMQYADSVVDRADDENAAVLHKILSGFEVVARTAGPCILSHILRWRVIKLNEAGQERTDIAMLRKRLWTESFFLDAALALVDAHPKVLTVQQIREMEHLVFDWILNADKYVPVQLGELLKLKDKVVLSASRLLGALSPLQLMSIRDRFLRELSLRLQADSNSPQRSELVSLTAGMRFVKLSSDSPAQLGASIAFLEAAHPLKHVASDKKSRVQQAVCDMLSSILQPLVDEGDPGKFGQGSDNNLIARWFTSVSAIRGDVMKWALKQSKQVTSAFPLLAALVCAEGDATFVGVVDGFVDHLHKQLRDRKNASLAILCLTRCVHCYCRRVRPVSTEAALAKWVARASLPVMQLVTRGALLLSEHQELVRQLCLVVSLHLPEYAVTMVLELLPADGLNWEAPMTGVAALLSMLMEVPGRAAGSVPNLQLASTVVGLDKGPPLHLWEPHHADEEQLLTLVKKGFNPLDAYGIGRMLPLVSAALSKLLVQCHAVCGSAKLTGSTRSFSDAPSKERMGALPAFAMALQCVPYVMPDHWTNGRICDDLVGYTIHCEGVVRQISTAVLHNCMYALPELRDKLVGSMALFSLRLPEEHVEMVQDTLVLLIRTMQEWGAMFAVESLGGDGILAQDFSTMSWVEGCILGLLCASSVKIRRLAAAIAEQVRVLYAELGSKVLPSLSRSNSLQWSEPDSAKSHLNRVSATVGASSFVADVIDRKSAAIVARCYWDFGRWSDLWRMWRAAPSPLPAFVDCLACTKSSSDHMRWARIMCELMKELWKKCPSAARLAHFEIYSKLQAATSLDNFGRSVLSEGKLDYGRALCLCLSAAHYMDSERLGDKEFSTRDYVRLLVSTCRSGVDSQQQVATLALGLIHPSCHKLVVQECLVLMEDYMLDRQMQRGISVPMPGIGRTHKPRREDIRFVHAHIYRLIADNMHPTSLQDSQVMRDKFVQFVVESARYIGANIELSPELIQLRYCLCVVCRQCSNQLADVLPQAFPADTRRTFYDMMSMWCEEGDPGHYRIEMRRGIALARSRVKDPEMARLTETEISESFEILEHAAYYGMAAMLKGSIFNADVRDPKGRVFGWIDRMLSFKSTPAKPPGCWSPPKSLIAEVALRNILVSNMDLTSVFIDRCYAQDSRISSGYFKTLAEVYSASDLRLPIEKHVALSLILHKVVDEHEEIRAATQAMLNVLPLKAAIGSSRLPQTPAADATEPEMLIIGELRDSYRNYQEHLAGKLATTYGDVAESLAVEMLSRQLKFSTDSEVLVCLCPWLQCVAINAQWRGHWTELFLGLLYEITTRRKKDATHIEQIWATLAQDRRNVVPILDYFIATSLEESQRGLTAGDTSKNFFVSAKQAVLYISRVAPRQTIEHLVYEIQQQLTEPDLSEPRNPATPDSTTILEYQHLQGHAAFQLVDLDVHGEPMHADRSGWSEADSPISSDANSFYGRRSGSFPARTQSENDTQHAAPPKERVPFAKSEVALILLTEVACEQDEEFRPHVDVLLHVITMNADNSNAFVRKECKQLLIFLLHGLVVKHLVGDGQSDEAVRVKKLILRLQNMNAKPMWPRERPTLNRPVVPSGPAVASFVKEVVECFHCNSDLRERWWGEALKWACTAHSRQLASRSHQVFCALRPVLSSLSCTAMLAALQKCMHNADVQKLDTAVEVLGTLRELLANAEPQKFLLYPQIFLAAVSLLNSSVVRIGELAMLILLKALASVNVGDAMVKNVLLAMINSPYGMEVSLSSSPQRDGDWILGHILLENGVADSVGAMPWMSLQQLVVKGFFHSVTERLALKVITQIYHQLADTRAAHLLLESEEEFSISSEGLIDSLVDGDVSRDPTAPIMGQTRAGLAIGLAATLPLLCLQLKDSARHGELRAYLEASSRAFVAAQWPDLGASFVTLIDLMGVEISATLWLTPFCRVLCREMFPLYMRLILQRILEVVERGSPEYQKAAVLILTVMFEVMDEVDRKAAVADKKLNIAKVLAPLISGYLGDQVLDTLEALIIDMSETSDEVVLPIDETLNWPYCIDPLGDCNKLCSDSLGRIVADASNTEGLNLEVLPFIK